MSELHLSLRQKRRRALIAIIYCHHFPACWCCHRLSAHIVSARGDRGDVGRGCDVPRCRRRCCAHQCCEKICGFYFWKPGGGRCIRISVQSKSRRHLSLRAKQMTNWPPVSELGFIPLNTVMHSMCEISFSVSVQEHILWTHYHNSNTWWKVSTHTKATPCRVDDLIRLWSVELYKFAF